MFRNIKYMFTVGIMVLKDFLYVISSIIINKLLNKKLTIEPYEIDDVTTLMGTSRYLEVNNKQYHLREIGQGTLIVALHGFPQSVECWRFIIPLLSKKYRCVTIDLLGMGKSQHTTKEQYYTLNSLTEDLSMIITTLLKDQEARCILVGHDWGGVLSWHLTRTYPNLISRFIPINAPSLETYKRHMFSNEDQLEKSWYVYQFQAKYIAECYLTHGNGIMFEKLLDDRLGKYKTFYTTQMLRSKNLSAALNYYRITGTENTSYLKNTKIECPTLIIWGKKDIYFDSKIVMTLKKQCKVVDVHYLPNACHFCLEENPKEIYNIITEWLKDTQKIHPLMM